MSVNKFQLLQCFLNSFSTIRFSELVWIITIHARVQEESVTMCRWANTYISRISKSRTTFVFRVRKFNNFSGLLGPKDETMRSSERKELLNQQHILIFYRTSPKSLVQPQVLHKFISHTNRSWNFIALQSAVPIFFRYSHVSLPHNRQRCLF
jgi:hypothetical protein